MPGANGSELVDEASGSTVLIARVKRNIGRNFVSVLVTDRESHDAQGFSRLAGPDILWRPTADDTINWQSVMFVGYGDERQQDDEHALAPVGRQLFVKVSYAFQR